MIRVLASDHAADLFERRLIEFPRLHVKCKPGRNDNGAGYWLTMSEALLRQLTEGA